MMADAGQAGQARRIQDRRPNDGYSLMLWYRLTPTAGWQLRFYNDPMERQTMRQRILASGGEIGQ